jgi:indole-3-acetate monooxygenase
MKLENIFSKEWAAKAEQKGSLPQEWLREVHQQKFFKLFIPNDLGGLGLGLPETLYIEESLAMRDASLGWVITLCAGAGWFVGFMDKDMREELAEEPKLCLAGSGYVGGKAEKKGDSYKISGSWTYASGALHASHFTANCELFEHGAPLLDLDGKPIVKAFILRKSEVKILDGWNYMGMIATGSHAFQCEELMLASHRCFEILPEKTTLPDPIYKYPFLQLAEATLAVNILGISIHFQGLISQSFWKRNEVRNFSKEQLDYFKKSHRKESNLVQSLRTDFYSIINSSWTELQEEEQLSKSSLSKVSKISRKLTQTCRESNMRLYPFAGLEAAKTHTELNRVWRDFNTVSQHALLTFPFPS